MAAETLLAPSRLLVFSLRSRGAVTPMVPCVAHPPLLSKPTMPAHPTHTAGPLVVELDVADRCPWGR